MSEENGVVVSDNQGKVDMSESKGKSLPKKPQLNESSGEWGSRKGKKFTFKKSVESMEGTPIYPLTYKNIEETEDSNGRTIITLKIADNEHVVKLLKEDLYKNFGMRTRRKKGQGGLKGSLDDEKLAFVNDKIVALLNDEKYGKILMSKDVEALKLLLDVSE